jgi:ABC-type multidrug transport system ATPase subunit
VARPAQICGSRQRILVTTHYMQEAEQCDRRVILTAGPITCSGTLEEITAVHNEVRDARPGTGLRSSRAADRDRGDHHVDEVAANHVTDGAR